MASTRLLADDFQFLLCEHCRRESPDLKLLTCLHTLCLGCLSKDKPLGQCPMCQVAVPQSSGMDNVLFTNLQAGLKVYEKIVEGVDLFCDNCKQASEFWCSGCKEFLCSKCFKAHQRYLKSHEAKRVMDISTGSAKDFLVGTWRTGNLFCSNPTHRDQTASIYCRTCEKALCCSCALLDSQHAPFCDLRGETRRRQEELSATARELKQKRGGFEATYAALRDEAARLEEERRELGELIRQRAEQLVRAIRREEEELLGLVEAHRERGRRELEGELRGVEGVLRRMEAGERLVEKMRLYATEQEVMDMGPFVKGSLEELQRLRPPLAGDRGQRRDLAECRARLQALVERVMGHPAPFSTTGTSTPQHSSQSADKPTLILNQESSLEEHCQPCRGLPMELPGHHQCCAPLLDPSSSRGHLYPGQDGDMSPTQPTPPACQRGEGAKEDSGSAHGDTMPLPRSIQDSLTSLQEDFSGWARSNVQQVDKFLKMGDLLLQAQRRQNRHLMSITQEIKAMSHSMATITSAVGPLLKPVASSQHLPSTDMSWLSLPSDLMELFSPSTSQNHELVVAEAAVAPSSSNPLPAGPPASPVCLEPSSPASGRECFKSKHPTRGKRGRKPSIRLQKWRKK